MRVIDEQEMREILKEQIKVQEAQRANDKWQEQQQQQKGDKTIAKKSSIYCCVLVIFCIATIHFVTQWLCGFAYGWAIATLALTFIVAPRNARGEMVVRTVIVYVASIATAGLFLGFILATVIMLLGSVFAQSACPGGRGSNYY